MTHTEV